MLRYFLRCAIVGVGLLSWTFPAVAQEVFGRVIPSAQHSGEVNLLNASGELCQPLFSPDDSVSQIINLPNSFYIECDSIESVGEALRNVLKDPAVSSVEIFYIR